MHEASGVEHCAVSFAREFSQHGCRFPTTAVEEKLPGWRRLSPVPQGGDSLREKCAGSAWKATHLECYRPSRVTRMSNPFAGLHFRAAFPFLQCIPVPSKVLKITRRACSRLYGQSCLQTLPRHTSDYLCIQCKCFAPLPKRAKAAAADV